MEGAVGGGASAELTVTDFLPVGTPVEITKPDELWMFEFTSTTGVVQDIDLVMAGHYQVKLDSPANYGGEHQLESILVHCSRLKKLASV